MRKGKKKKTSRALIALAVVVVIALAVLFVAKIGLFEFNLNLPSGGDGGSGDGSDGSDGSDSGSGDSTVPPDEKPSSLMVKVYPTSATMGDIVCGEVVSDVGDYPVTIHAKLLGTGHTQEYGGRLNDDAKFTDCNPINIPGYWDIWASTDSVTSKNTPRLTVEGVLIVLPVTTISQSMGSPVVAQLFSHTSGNAEIRAIDTSTGASTYLTNAVIDGNGFGDISIDFTVLPRANYEVKVLINGLDSSSYGGSAYLTVGR